MKNYSRTNFPREVSVDDMYKPVFVDTQKKDPKMWSEW